MYNYNIRMSGSEREQYKEKNNKETELHTPVVEKVCSHCFAMVDIHPHYPLCDNTSCESDDCWCHIKFCNKSTVCIHCSVLIYLHPMSPLCNNASCVSDDC